MVAAAILDFSKFSISDDIFQFPLCPGICSSNFIQKLNPGGTYNISVNQDGGGAILDF